jgi:uncharacterized protein YceH (UPF0502 family)
MAYFLPPGESRLDWRFCGPADQCGGLDSTPINQDRSDAVLLALHARRRALESEVVELCQRRSELEEEREAQQRAASARQAALRQRIADIDALLSDPTPPTEPSPG